MIEQAIAHFEKEEGRVMNEEEKILFVHGFNYGVTALVKHINILKAEHLEELETM